MTQNDFPGGDDAAMLRFNYARQFKRTLNLFGFLCYYIAGGIR